MKKIIQSISIFIITSFTITLYSCSDDPVNSGTTYYTINSISGTVNGLDSSIRELRAVLLPNDSTSITIASQNIGSNNSFNLNLPAPPSNAIYDIDLLYSYLNPILISDHDANANLLVFHMFDAASTLRGYLTKDNRTTTLNFPGYFRINIIYCDRNVNISGFQRRIVNNDTSDVTYNLAFTTGYNVFFSRIKTTRVNYQDIEVLSSEPAGAVWHYESLQDAANRKNINPF